MAAAAIDERLPVGKDVRCAGCIIAVVERESPSLDHDERRAGMAVPAGVPAALNRDGLVSSFDRITAPDAMPEVTAEQGTIRDGRHRLCR
ncbi:MAG: hypothetical protein M3377_00840 [Actinomycetota bacterium]|nr:hypothetical protein [Actinomycetota bacterium]